MGERVTGGTVYWLGDVDAGDVAAQEHVFIRPDDTAEELWQRELFPLGLRLFERVLIDLEVAQGAVFLISQGAARNDVNPDPAGRDDPT
jgi:methionyl-tRNA formyltransferase